MYTGTAVRVPVIAIPVAVNESTYIMMYINIDAFKGDEYWKFFLIH